MRYAIAGATAEQIRNAGGTDIKETKATGIIFATLDEAGAAKLRAIGAKVSPVGNVKPAVMPPMPVTAAPLFTAQELITLLGFDYIRQLTEPPLYGRGINVAIVDTGIRDTHELIKDRVIYSKNYTSDPMRDGFDHGTGVCSIVLTTAPDCNILNLKVLDDKGAGTEEELVLAIDDCISLHGTDPDIAPSVINLSLGSPDDGNPDNPVRVACRAALEKGMWIPAAAGNSGPSPGTIMSPACEKLVCATGCCSYQPETKTYYLSEFSSRGPTKEGLVKPDIAFFGDNIVMASSASDTATVAKSGTSFSNPFMSGLIAIYLEGTGKQLTFYTERFPGFIEEVKAIFSELMSPDYALNKFLPDVSIKPQGMPKGKDNGYGYGVPFGPLVLQQMLQTVRPTLDLSPLLGGLVVVGMMGMMVKVMD
jgi:serine protease AprX